VIDGMSVLAIIPARGGSKGLPGKNIIDFCGRPLIAWTIEAAKNSRYVDRLILSTDDPGIAEVCRQHDCEVPYMRPQNLATDSASSLEVVIHAIQNLPDYDIILLLQPTSPLRTSTHIDEALAVFVDKKAENCISVTRVSENPHWMFKLDEGLRLRKFVEARSLVQRRQDLEPLYIPNGAIYIIKSELVEKSQSLILDNAVAYEMDSETSVDIDTEIDLQVAKILKRG
jgi:CMP-N,N'-diacetyllegionaminic acid synthase